MKVEKENGARVCLSKKDRQEIDAHVKAIQKVLDKYPATMEEEPFTTTTVMETAKLRFAYFVEAEKSLCVDEARAEEAKRVRATFGKGV